MSCCCLCLFYLIAGVFYPLSQTYKSYQLKENQALWINYWIVVSGIWILEMLTFGFLECIPLYGLMKTLYGIWLYHDNFQGALLIGSMMTPIFKQISQVLAPVQSHLDKIDTMK